MLLGGTLSAFRINGGCATLISFLFIFYITNCVASLLRNTGLWWVQMSAVAATLLERPVLDHQLQLTLAELAVKVWCHLLWHQLVTSSYILHLATVYESKFSQNSHQVLTFWFQIQINFSFKSRSASCAQLSRRGSNFVSSASKCFPWELPKLTHYAKRQKSICKHHQASLSQTNILSSYRDQPKNSSCCFGLGVFCCIYKYHVFHFVPDIYPYLSPSPSDVTSVFSSANGLDAINFFGELLHLATRKGPGKVISAVVPNSKTGSLQTDHSVERLFFTVNLA